MTQITTYSKYGLALLGAGILLNAGCRTPAEYRKEADKTAYEIVDNTRKNVLNRQEEKFSIERPSETLRRRLTNMQDLPAYSSATIGADKLKKPEHWPDSILSQNTTDTNSFTVAWTNSDTITLTLADSIKIAARNSREYQSAKESVFKSALQLDLERNNFRSTFSGALDSELSRNTFNDSNISGSKTGAKTGVTKTLESGASVSGLIALDIVKLLTGDRDSAWGLSADATVSIPLLRGAGKYIVREPLTQAERNVVYAIYDFEEFKRSLAVDIETAFMRVMQANDQTENAKRNYDTLTIATERAETLAEAGRLPGFQVDQARQDQLRSYSRLVQTTQHSKQALDRLKSMLGLPPDAKIQLSLDSFHKLVSDAEDRVKNTVPIPDPHKAIITALENRLDMRVAAGKVLDSQRAVVIAADALRSEITLLGSASTGGSRSFSSADDGNVKPDLSKGALSGLLTVDLALERTAERNNFRNSLIELNRSIRDAQKKEDDIKLQIIVNLQDLRTATENINTQLQAEKLAAERQKSTALFLKAGRADMRDLLDAQEALLSARNALTAAIISYRITEINLQSNMGLLQVTDEGLTQEQPFAELETDGATQHE